MSSIVEVAPRFRIALAPCGSAVDDRTIVIQQSRAFGDGRHESTRMSLQAIAAFAPRRPFRVLDVGSGSGILSIGAAKLGGTGVGVEIDRAAIAVAEENARLSGVSERVSFSDEWPTGTFDLVVANILRDVLVALREKIAARRAAGAPLVLSGLVSTDAPELIAAYAPLVGGKRPAIFERGVWRTLVYT